MLAWNIAATGERFRTINNQMKEAIRGYSWVRPLRAVYIIKIEEAEDRDVLHARLKKVVADVSEKVNYIISPPMEGGRYNGWLPRPMWGKINERLD
jgi:hypothetical protein